MLDAAEVRRGVGDKQGRQGLGGAGYRMLDAAEVQGRELEGSDCVCQLESEGGG
jgi:hypothetical protein